MTQPFDEQLRETFDSLAEGLRATLAEHLSVAAEQLAGSVEFERQTASVHAAREAAAAAERDVAARLNAAFALREAHIREAVHVGSFEAGLQQARAEAEAREEAREAEARAKAEAAEQTAAEHSAALASARAAAEAWKAEADAANAETDAAKKAADARIDLASVDRLLRAVRSLDAATSLSQALDGAGRGCPRGGRPHGDLPVAWRHAPRLESRRLRRHAAARRPSRSPLAEAGVTADVVGSGLSQRIAATADRRPAFAGAATAGVFVAVPLAMNSQVIGVLCGEQLSTSDEGQWLAMTYEILARHAARVLESRTALRLAQLGSPPVGVVPVSPPLHT